MSMQMAPINSNATSAVGYNLGTMQMNFRFKQNHTYSFCGVPQYIFDGPLSASSKAT
jgi:hypothetical protein